MLSNFPIISPRAGNHFPFQTHVQHSSKDRRELRDPLLSHQRFKLRKLRIGSYYEGILHVARH